MENREPEKSNPNHRKVFYFLNILFMCMITAASLAMTVILFVRLERLRSEKQVEGSIYTDSQIEKIRYGAAQAERNRLLLEIQSSFESGNSTISMLRNLFPGDLVVMWEGRYYFYPVDRNLQTNPFSETDFAQGEKGGMEYIGEDAGVSVNRGVDVSALNGEINYVDLDADSEKAAEEIADFVLSNLSMSQQEMGAPVAVRVQIPDHTSSLNGQTREEWTQGVRAFCAKIKKAGYEPVIYANTAAFHMLLNMAELEEYDKWIADYGDYLYFPYKFKCWQYSLKGTVNGIEGDVALDLSVSTE